MIWPSKKPRSESVVRDTFRHTVVYSGTSLLARVVSFFLLPFYAHILRDIGYGVLGMIDAGLALLSSLFAYNFNGGIIRFYHAETAPERQTLVVSTGTILAAAIVLPIATIGALLSKPASNLLLGTPEYWFLICLALGSFVFGMIDKTAFSILIILRRSVLVSAISLVLLVVSMGLNILFVLILGWGLTGYFVAGLLSNFVSAIISLIIMVRLCGIRWDSGIARSLLAYQLPLIPGSLAEFLSRQAERVIVRFRLDLAAVGVLEMAYKFPVLINGFIVIPFNRSWGPKSMEIAGQPGGRLQISKMLTYFLFVNTFAYVLLVGIIETALKILTPSEFWAAAHIVRIEAAQQVVRAVGTYACFGLYYAKRTDLVSRAMVVTSVLKIGLSYFMVSTWGLYGAAWSALLASTVYGVWTAVLARRFYRLDFEWRRMLTVVGIGAAVVISVGAISTEQIASWGGPLLQVMEHLLRELQHTAVGDWRDGRLLAILGDRTVLVLDLIVRLALSCSFLLIAPLVHEQWRRFLPFRRIGRHSIQP